MVAEGSLYVSRLDPDTFGVNWEGVKTFTEKARSEDAAFANLWILVARQTVRDGHAVHIFRALNECMSVHHYERNTGGYVQCNAIHITRNRTRTTRFANMVVSMKAVRYRLGGFLWMRHLFFHSCRTV